MSRKFFPMLATSMGLFLHLLLLWSGVFEPDEGLSLPLLTLLFIAEFGLFVTIAGVIAGGMALSKQGFGITLVAVVLSCTLFAAGFVIVGWGLWKLIA